ncbi:MAG: ferritin-like domain-containing protein [Solirubrobacteraceae bacterium]
MSEPRSRRRLLADGARLAAAGAAGGALSSACAAGAETRKKPPPSDAMLVAQLIVLERVMQDVYGRAITSGQLDSGGLALAHEVLGHERIHESELRRQLRLLSGTALPVPRSTKELEKELAKHHTKVALDRHRSGRGWLKLLVDVEDVLERNYHTAISILRSSSLLTLASEILASEAQHSALLGDLLSPRNVQKALPNAFINGT